MVQKCRLWFPLRGGRGASGIGADPFPGFTVLGAGVQIQLHRGLVLPFVGGGRAGFDVLCSTVWGGPSSTGVEAATPPFPIGPPSVLALQPSGLREADLGAGGSRSRSRSLPSAPAPSHLQVTRR